MSPVLVQYYERKQKKSRNLKHFSSISPPTSMQEVALIRCAVNESAGRGLGRVFIREEY